MMDDFRMDTKNKTAGSIIVAAGKASRMGGDINKQFMDIAGIPVLARTVSVFASCSLINEIVVVVNSTEKKMCEDLITQKGFQKVSAVTEGGQTRQQSVYNGLLALSVQPDIVLVHDGARPFINKRIIGDCVDAAGRHGACCAAVPVKDTIKAANREHFVDKTLDRKRLWAVQTPQAFQYRLIMDAHSKAIEDGFLGTDDSVLVERLGKKVRLVMGNYYNIKITTPEDIVLAEAIAKVIRRGI